jgi:hypothetical protein
MQDPVSGIPPQLLKEIMRLRAIRGYHSWWGYAWKARKDGLYVIPCPVELWNELVARDPAKAAYYRKQAINKGLGDLLPPA